jgi:predicted aspartyl protease
VKDIVMRLFSACLAFLLLAAPAAAERLSFSPDGHVQTPVMVNGQGPFDFVVDTAAGGSVVYPALRERLALQPLSNARVQVQGASGRTPASLYRLDRVEIAGQVREAVTAVGLEAVGSAGADMLGIVGVDVISAFIAEFDVPGGRFELRDPSTDLAASGWRSIAFTLNRARFVVLEGSLDGRAMPMLLDTGARRTVINWAAARALGIAPDSPGLAPAEPVRGATAHQTAAVKRDFSTLSIDGLALSANEITIADLPVFERLGWADRPAMILGMDRMRAHHFAVDYGRTRLLIAPAVPAQVAAR